MGIARTLARFLQAQRVPCELLQHRYAEGSYNTARCAEVPAQQLLKGVVFRDEDLFYTMAIVPSNHRVLRHTLNDILGGHLELAEEDELEVLFFDCAPGAIPALGQAYGMNVIWDRSLAAAEDLWLEAGDHYHLVRLSQADFQRLMGHHLCDNISRERRRLKLQLVTSALAEAPNAGLAPAAGGNRRNIQPGI